MAEPVFHRLHPLSILIEAVRVVGRMALAIVFLVISLMTGSKSDMTEVFATGLGMVVVVFAVFRYLTFRYAIQDGNLHIKSGLIVRQNRTIPLDRIQNINLTRTWVHRILGLVDVEIETASGAKAEASLSAVTDEQAHVLKARLSGQAPRIVSHVLEARRANVVYRASVKELILAGATENRLLAIIASIVGLQFVFQGMIERIAEQKQWMTLMKSPAMIAAVAVGMLLVGWIVSIVTTLVKYYNFELILEDGKLRRQYGLINHIENVVPIRRVQVIRVKQTLLQRLFKVSKVYVETAGAYGEAKDPSAGTASSLITPILAVNRFPMMSELVYPKASLTDVSWKQVSRWTVWRHTRSIIAIALILGVASYFFIKLWALAVFGGFVSLAFLSGLIYYRTGRFADHNDVIVARRGLVGRQTWYVPCDKVQCVGVSQSPIQRRLGLMTVSISTAAQNLHSDSIAIEDLLVQDALDLANSIHDRSARSQDSLLDGF